MNKSCKNCSLFKSENEKTGYCDFWRRIVVVQDYCVEHRERKGN